MIGIDMNMQDQCEAIHGACEESFQGWMHYVPCCLARNSSAVMGMISHLSSQFNHLPIQQLSTGAG